MLVLLSQYEDRRRVQQTYLHHIPADTSTDFALPEQIADGFSDYRPIHGVLDRSQEERGRAVGIQMARPVDVFTLTT